MTHHSFSSMLNIYGKLHIFIFKGEGTKNYLAVLCIHFQNAVETSYALRRKQQKHRFMSDRWKV